MFLLYSCRPEAPGLNNFGWTTQIFSVELFMYMYVLILVVQYCSKLAHTSGSNEPPVVHMLWVEMRSDDCRSPLNVSDLRQTCYRT